MTGHCRRSGPGVGLCPVCGRMKTPKAAADTPAEVLCHDARSQAFHRTPALPADRFARVIAAHFGPWLPMHLDPVLKLMKAVRASGTGAVVVNAAYPDAVHPALAEAGLSPALGIGNAANSVPALRTIALPPRLGERDAVEINRDGQRHDGIARIAEDGLVEFTDESVEIMREELGYTCKQLALADVEEAADELAARYAECCPR